MTPDVYTGTSLFNQGRRPMVCANCHGHFAGTDHNLIEAKAVDEQVVATCVCDVCLKELGGIARG